MASIVCVGCALADILIRGLTVKDSRIQTDFKNRFHFADHIQAVAGGDALNEAIVLGRLEKNVKLVCGLGDDFMGRSIEGHVKSAGVDTSHIIWHTGKKTPINVLLVQPDKEKYFIEEPDLESMCFIPEDSVFCNADIVSMASLFSAPFDSKEVIHRTICAAKKQGAIVCADVILTPFTVLSLRDCLLYTS